MKKKRKKGRILAAVCICSLAAGLLGGCEKNGKKEEEAQSLPEMIVGSDNYPPFNYIDKDGEATGIDVDLAEEAFARMGYRAVFETINWEEKKELLENGKIDCIWGSFTMDGREDEYNWAGPYMTSRQVIAVLPESEITSLSDLKDKRIAVQSTTKPEELFRAKSDSRIPDLLEVISVQNRELIYTFLSKGYADAIAAHETAIQEYMKDYDISYRILDEPLLTVGLGVAFDKKDDRGLAEQLSATFEEMRKDGTTEEIIGKYLENPKKYLEVEEDEK